MAATSALEFLRDLPRNLPLGVCVLSGDSDFLKIEVLRALRRKLEADGDRSQWHQLEGPKLVWPDLVERLHTVALFGGVRVVAVEEAEPFVTRCRKELETLAAKKAEGWLLILLVRTFASNTRLAKIVAESGLWVDCAAPTGSGLEAWVVAWAKQRYELAVSGPAARLLVEMVGEDLGVIDQELAKLAVATDSRAPVKPEVVKQFAGGWRLRTVWEMLDAALEGRIAAALEYLDKLLQAGEHPVAILAQLGGALRRLVISTQLAYQKQSRGRKVELSEALREAGVPHFLLSKVEMQLRRLGAQRASEIAHLLLTADLGMKGDCVLPERLLLERFLLRLAVH